MGTTETSIFYGIIGVVVAAAMWLSGTSKNGLARAGLFGVHAVLWPFFAPILLGRAVSGAEGDQRALEATSRDPRLCQAEEQLWAALSSLDGIAEDVLGPDMARVKSLTGSLEQMSHRLAEMDELLKSPEFDERRVRAALEEMDTQRQAGDSARASSIRARLRNIERLEQMRRGLSADFERAILKIEEISSQISLLRFADHPEQEVGELIQDIAATVEGLSEGLLSS